MPKYYKDIDMSVLDFKLDTRTGVTTNIIDLDKSVSDDTITLTWTILESQLTISNNLQVQVRAFNNAGVEKWHSNIGYVTVKASINAEKQIPSPLPSEFEQMETRVTVSKNETVARADEVAVNTQTVLDNTAIVLAKASEASESADNAYTSEVNAKTSETNAGVSEVNAHTSEVNALASAGSAGLSETNAKASEDKAKISEDNAKLSETNSKTSETNAGTSETNALQAEQRMVVQIGELANLNTTDKTNVVSAVNEVNTNKVDKLTGKQLSTEDYTTAEKSKVANVPADTVGELANIANTVGDMGDYLTFIDIYNESLFNDIMGVEVDFENRAFTRLAGAVNRTPGADFDNILAFGGRRRCNLADDGTVNAYFGDAEYIEDGSNGQVMVEQPKFYYKVVPLKLEKVQDGKGFHMRKARYYVSDTKKAGFKLHPAFIHDGKEKNFIYLSAYEGSVYDKSASAYLLADEQIVDFAVDTGDLLSSIAYAKPTSGVTQAGATRIGFRRIAANRGEGWSQAYAATVSATQLLLTIEYGTMNSQTALGKGVVDKPSGEETISYADITGATTNLGNASGMAAGTNGLTSVTYRGEENFWGNIWAWVDGLNIFNQSDLYVADNDFADDIGTEPYKDAGITLSKVGGYVSAFGYNEEFDWLFFPSETTGNSALPVGDNFYQTTTLNAWRVARLGSNWNSTLTAGAFCWHVISYAGIHIRSIGGRLVYVPDAA